jgi:hypothetical protein
MNFIEIFEQDGLYRGESFIKGFAYKIENGILYSVDYGVDKQTKVISPKKESYYLITKGLIKQEFKLILNVNQLYQDFENI